MLHTCILVGISRINGRGLLAIAPIRAGETTWWHDPAAPAPDGATVTRAELARLSSQEREAFHIHAWQIGPDTWCADSPEADPSLLMNHSCDPNTWFVSDSAMVARRDIAAGEEITYDYATSETEQLGVRCRCGSPRCRAIVRDDDCALPELRERFAGHRLSHVDAALAREQPNTVATNLIHTLR